MRSWRSKATWYSSSLLRRLALLLFVILALAVVASIRIDRSYGDEVQTSPNPISTTVGEYGRLRGLILPGTMLQAKSIRGERPKLVLRLAAIYPHGTSHRYDLEYYGLEPGAYDLRDYLERVDRSTTTDLPAIPVRVRSLLPIGQILPNKIASRSPPRIGGYTALAVVAVVLWTWGLLAILLVRRRRGVDASASRPQTSLAEYLRPRLEAARNGQLTPRQFAELERWIVEAWRRRIGLHELSAPEALIRLRHDETAGPPLRKLEKWLHQPQTESHESIAEILRPYDEWSIDIESLSKGSSKPSTEEEPAT